MAVLGASILMTNGAVRVEDLNLFYAVILIFIGLFFLTFKSRSRRDE